MPSAAEAITFGPTITGLGPEEVVFDHSAETCTNDGWDIPDQPARAFRDDKGRVQLHFSHLDAYRNIGVDLNDASTPAVASASTGGHDCSHAVFTSHRDYDPSKFDDYSWIAAPYTLNGQTIYSLLHEEWRGPNHPPPWSCSPVGDDYTVCWYNAITLGVSNNSGDSFTTSSIAPGHLVASLPYQWVDRTGPYGVFTPSNIIKKGDGFYYALVRAKEPAKPDVTCLIRTDDLSKPGSWRAWNGTDFTMQFVNPYTWSATPGDPISAHVCADVGGGLVTGVSESLTYNTYFGKYIIVGAYGNPVPGFFYSLSDDLIHWSYPKLLVGAETTHSYTCGDPDPVRDPSLLDPTSTTAAEGTPSRNFETTGKQAYLYYTVLHSGGGCSASFSNDRDLLRVQVEFNKENKAPSASFTLSPNPAQPGQQVLFNGLSSSDPDGAIVDYKWDLDGDGTFETSTGSTSTVSHAYSALGTVTIRLRVTDDNGTTADASQTLTMKNPASAAVAPSTTPTISKQTTTTSDARCAAVRTKKRRLQLLLRSIRRNLARAKSPAGKLHYRRRIASVKRQLKRLAAIKCKCPETRKKGAELEQRLQTARNNLAAAQTATDKARYQREIRSLNLQLRRLADACQCADKRRKRAGFQKRLEAVQRKLAAAKTGPEKSRYQSQIKALKKKIQRLRCSR